MTLRGVSNGALLLFTKLLKFNDVNPTNFASLLSASIVRDTIECRKSSRTQTYVDDDDDIAIVAVVGVVVVGVVVFVVVGFRGNRSWTEEMIVVPYSMHLISMLLSRLCAYDLHCFLLNCAYD